MAACGCAQVLGLASRLLAVGPEVHSKAGRAPADNLQDVGAHVVHGQAPFPDGTAQKQHGSSSPRQRISVQHCTSVQNRLPPSRCYPTGLPGWAWCNAGGMAYLDATSSYSSTRRPADRMRSTSCTSAATPGPQRSWMLPMSRPPYSTASTTTPAAMASASRGMPAADKSASTAARSTARSSGMRPSGRAGAPCRHASASFSARMIMASLSGPQPVPVDGSRRETWDHALASSATDCSPGELRIRDKAGADVGGAGACVCSVPRHIFHQHAVARAAARCQAPSSRHARPICAVLLHAAALHPAPLHGPAPSSLPAAGLHADTTHPTDGDGSRCAAAAGRWSTALGCCRRWQRRTVDGSTCC